MLWLHLGAGAAGLWATVWAAPSAAATCKAIPGSHGWPTDAQWASFNSSLPGKLIKATPPGAACHPQLAAFDKSQCAYVASHWTSSLFHANDPVSIDYNDDTCYPDASDPCSAEGYARYVVNASTADDVKAGVDFARKHNIRLIIKGTGHDFNGRSSGPNSLSIWTHHLRGMQFYDDFSPQNCYSQSGPAVKIAAGLQMRDIQLEASTKKVMVVGGADPDVGLGGFLSGGGHSPISSKYGLAADQALELQIVTADGQIRTVNECSYPDLFWAMRGGGPSTFGVLLSATVRTYPTIPVTYTVFSLSTTGNSDSYWEMNAYFHSQLPHLNDQGLMGYYFALSMTPGVTDKAQQGKVVGGFLALNKSASEAAALFNPLKTHLGKDPFPDKAFFTAMELPFQDFYSYWSSVNPPAAVGFDGRLGSRLLDEHSLTSNRTALIQALQQSSPDQNVLLGHLVAGKGVKDAKPAGGSDAVNPAWRKAYVHAVMVAEWPLLNYTRNDELTRQLTYERVAALRTLVPNSGAYVNEADPDEPNWQETFWGDHYGRLLSIKREYDPQGVFYCFPCVGAEHWQVVGGRLCERRPPGHGTGDLRL